MARLCQAREVMDAVTDSFRQCGTIMALATYETYSSNAGIGTSRLLGNDENSANNHVAIGSRIAGEFEDLAGVEGFEPPTPGFGDLCSNRTELHP